MALGNGPTRQRSLMDDELRSDAGLSNDLYERDTGRSNFAAFLLGGVVIAGGLLGFLYYDTDNLSQRDGLTTGSLGQIESPGPAPTLRLGPETAPAAPPAR